MAVVTLMLLDSASLYFRTFYGVPDTVRAPDGTLVNAVRGFLDAIAVLIAEHRPSHLVACWDDDWRPQFRVDALPSYKAHRVAEEAPEAQAAPDELGPQVPIIIDLLAALGIARLGSAGFEADDVIATLATESTDPVLVVSGDRDLFQLVRDDQPITVLYTAKGLRIRTCWPSSRPAGDWAARSPDCPRCWAGPRAEGETRPPISGARSRRRFPGVVR